jgi:hypothetical protein
MKTLATAVTCACLMLTASGVAAQGTMPKMDAMSKPMTMQECKDHMAMAKKDGMTKKDDAMMKKDTMCAEMMKKDGAMMKDGAMKDGMTNKDTMAPTKK